MKTIATYISWGDFGCKSENQAQVALSNGEFMGS